MRELIQRIALLIFALFSANTLSAHDWHLHGEPISEAPFVLPSYAETEPDDSEVVAARASLFANFMPKVRYSWDEEFFYIESDSLPDHEMMTGITSWQQQVPIFQPYFGNNRWRIPLNPIKTNTGVSAQTSLFRGAIAIAVNGVPIFNPIKNDGVTDTFLAGELDNWGGHCGRADDYHYHIYPWHLQESVGETSPAAFALDGFPIYGDKEADGTDVNEASLDSFAGHTHDGSYHYHGSHSYPYINGGVWTNPPLITVQAGTGNNTNEGIDPQPGGQGVRPALTPLSGATITGFSRVSELQYLLSYTRNSENHSLTVTFDKVNGEASFGWTDVSYGSGAVSPQVYSGLAAPPDSPKTSIDIRQSANGNLSFLMAGEPGQGYPFYQSDDAETWTIFGHRLLNQNGTTFFELTPGLTKGYFQVPPGSPGADLYMPTESAGAISQGGGVTTVTNLFDYPQGRVSAVGTVTDSAGMIWTVPAANDFANSAKIPDLYNETVNVTPANIDAVDLDSIPIVEVDPDGEVITGYLFADNYFELYVNGTLVGVDPVPYTPLNSCVVKFRAKAPITYAVKLINWEENLGLGTEYHNETDNPHYAGSGGFIAAFSDGTVTDSDWKSQTFYIAPVDHPSNVADQPDGTRDSSSVSVEAASANSYALHYPVPSGWTAPDFDDSGWPSATTFSEQEIGVNNEPAYSNFTSEFSPASFIWSSNVALDNEVIVRFTTQAQPDWSMEALPDTGQQDDFTALSGEDSDYTINPLSYTDNGDGTVTDNVTGLMWQQSDGGEMTWDNAAIYCGSLTLGTHSDWRLPTAHELFSIAHLNERHPPLDPLFDSPASAQYWWTSDERVGTDTHVWALNRGGGHGPKPKAETVSAGGAFQYHVRAVRDVAPTSDTRITSPQLTDNGNGTVTDANTGLIWQQGESAELKSWEDALIYAEGLSLAGHNDWRVPNIKELFSIIDTYRSAPAVDTAFFPGASGSEEYWSSTVNFNRSDEPWYCDLQYGLTSFGIETTLRSVRCVRGGNDPPEPPTAPNIILLVSDDIGYADLGVHGSSQFVSPSIDSIATNGVRFTQGYVAGAKCSPSRAGFLTGRYQQRFGHEENVPGNAGLPLTQTLIPNHLKSNGLNYRSYLIGKWHLGNGSEFLPNARGFDDFFGFKGGFRSFFALPNPSNSTRLWRNNTEVAEPDPGVYLTDVWGDEAAAAIDNHVANFSGQPMFMYCAFNAIHEPIEVTDTYYNDARISGIADTEIRKLAAMTLALDVQVGKILARLDANGIADNTMVVYINDNGGLGSVGSDNTPLRGGKGSLFEGGIRIPFMMQWPHSISSGQVVDHPVMTLDLLPTFMAAASGSVAAEVRTDGANLLPLLTGESTEAPHDILYWRTEGLISGNSALRKGDWKLHRSDDVGGGTVRLFNLATDLDESSNVAGANPDVVNELLADLTAWENELVVPIWAIGSPEITGANLIHAELGYELSDPDAGYGYALIERRYPLSLNEDWTLNCTMDLEAVNSAATNGFLVLGDGSDTANVIRLGLDKDSGKLMITESQPNPDSESSITIGSTDLPSGETGFQVSYENVSGTVTLSYGSQSVSHVLSGTYSEFTFSGYAVEAATTRFSPIR